MPSAGWAIDIGTTNTLVARFDEGTGFPRVVRLPNVCRAAEGGETLEAPSAVPSATDLLEGNDLWTRLGRIPWLGLPWGKEAHIGRQALERNLGIPRASFVRSFKPYLQHEATRPIAKVGQRAFTAREVTRIFLRELFLEVRRTTDERIGEIVACAPVEAYEAYRAEIGKALEHIGVRRVRFVDEPVAAAAGYGLSIRDSRTVLVVDFGGGTMHAALVAIDAKAVDSGRARVLAKQGRSVGGNLVDRWFLESIYERLGARIPEDEFRARWMVDEARRVKEALFFRESEVFTLDVADARLAHAARAEGVPELHITRDDLVEVMRKRGVYDMIDAAVGQALEAGEPDDILLVGGSTLLPGIFRRFEERFGRDRVRAWQPFEAVALGASALAAHGFAPADFIVHDYAIVVHDPATNEKKHVTIVQAGTRFPTAADHWRQQLVPTCALGEPETVFKLVIAEIGRAPEAERSFGFDQRGGAVRLDGNQRLVVPLNETNPTLGRLDPPHPPRDRAPRLDVSFGVDEDRWLVATVVDLKTNRPLLKSQPVVRLL